MSTAFQIFQGALGGLIAFFFAILLMDSGLSAFKEIVLFVVIGAAIYGAVWFLHRAVDGTNRANQNSVSNSLPLKVGAGFFIFASIKAVGVHA
ncbi:MAG: hypothetical protein JXR15_19215 [Shimia sp.]|uniref:hypothetical protein n=1 Tax=Shimia sp. TaxID=1954381 RepID=UPI003B8D40AA